ncbi:MAG TPA: c-type cytochrome, partial [Planctomycetaceae bacterium]|nr:c-type cytochrome [Planctomycetaceae bacterium]
AAVATVYAEREDVRSPSPLFLELLQQSIAFGARDAVAQFYQRFVEGVQGEPAAHFRAVRHLLDAYAQTRVPWQSQLPAPIRGSIEATIDRARQLVDSAESFGATEAGAIELLGRQAKLRTADLELLGGLLRPQVPQEIQQRAIARLSATGDASVGKVLIAAWRRLSPARRNETLDVLFSRNEWTNALLDAIERGDVGANDLGAARDSMLRHHYDAAIRKRAEQLLQPQESDRQEVVDRFLSEIASLSPSAARGKEVFGKRCATCHRLEDVGNQVGADLLTLTDRSTPFLVRAILDPNRAVEDRFQSYVVALADGRVLSGLLVDETGNSLVLLDQEAKRHDVLRQEVEEIAATGKSLMPEGLEKELSAQDVADVVGYLQQFDWTPKSFPGNMPQVAPVRDDGSIRMLAIHARIYGPKLVFEQKYRNLGYWQSQRDMAVWDLKIIRAGKYNVYMEYACPPASAGNRFVLAIQGKSLAGAVDSTGSWSSFTMRRIGVIELEPGKAEATLRSDGPVRGALFDLRSVRLLPIGG